MKKYRFSWEHCFREWRREEFQTSTLEEAKNVARGMQDELGHQITDGPELLELGEVIDF